MEARTSNRAVIRRNVVLHASGNNLVRGKLRDLSTGGMYIETDAEAKIRRNAMVRIGFMVENSLTIAKGRVVRSAHDGIGVVLVDDQPEVVHALESLLGPHRSRPAANSAGSAVSVT